LATATTPIASSGWTASRIVRLGVFARAKDISESRVAIQAACRHGLAKGDKSERGRLRGWECILNDPALKKRSGVEPIPNPKGVRGSISFGGTMGEFMTQGNDQRNDVQSDFWENNVESDGQSVAPRMKFNVLSRDLCCNNTCSRMTLTQLPLLGLRKDRVCRCPGGPMNCSSLGDRHLLPSNDCSIPVCTGMRQSLPKTAEAT
jgi:hypothetical protein